MDDKRIHDINAILRHPLARRLANYLRRDADHMYETGTRLLMGPFDAISQDDPRAAEMAERFVKLAELAEQLANLLDPDHL